MLIYMSCNVSSLIARAMKPTLAQLTMMKTATGEKFKIIESVAPQWKELGDLLDFDPEGRTLELIEANNQQEGLVACCREMFVYWLKGKGREATWVVLIELLDDIGQSELARKVKIALSGGTYFNKRLYVTILDRPQLEADCNNGVVCSISFCTDSQGRRHRGGRGGHGRPTF